MILTVAPKFQFSGTSGEKKSLQQKMEQLSSSSLHNKLIFLAADFRSYFYFYCSSINNAPRHCEEP